MAYTDEMTLTSRMPFGKYGGDRILSIIDNDINYFEWMVKKTDLNFYEEVLEVYEAKKDDPRFELRSQKTEITRKDAESFMVEKAHGCWKPIKGNEADEYIKIHKFRTPRKLTPTAFLLRIMTAKFAKWLIENHESKALELGL